MAYLAELLKGVASSLMRNKLRSVLTMAGIAWGVASIVLIVAMCDGFREGQRQNTRSLGENFVIVWGGRTESQAGGQRAGRRIRLTYGDIVGIRGECYHVKLATPELMTEVRAQSLYNSGTFETDGVEPEFTDVRTVPIAQGRFVSRRDVEGTGRVCFIGSNVKKQLFGTRTDVIGAEIRLNQLPFRVIGVMEDKNQNSNYSGRDVDKIWVPYTTMVRDLPPKDPTWREGVLSNLIYVPASLDQWEETQGQVRRVIGRNHGFASSDRGALSMWDSVEGAQMVGEIFNSMSVFLGAIALVTLTLGGVGVMNIMLVSVTERTQEIGIRKALGATRRRILADYLAEGMLLAFASGVVGWSLSWSLATLVNRMPKQEMFAGLPVTLSTTVAAFGALGIVAVASAVWPAWRAARLTPVEALRHER